MVCRQDQRHRIRRCKPSLACSGFLPKKPPTRRGPTSPQIIRAAISRGEIDSVKVGGVNLVKANKKFKQ